jgi:cyclopropane-fatty-acyl-phospholipid synthase
MRLAQHRIPTRGERPFGGPGKTNFSNRGKVPAREASSLTRAKAEQPSGDPMTAVMTRPLRRALEESVPDRPFTVRFWDGGELPATSPGGPVLTFSDPAGLAHIVRRPGPLGFFRGYVDGHLRIDDLDKAWHAIDEWEPPQLSVTDRGRVLLTAMIAAAKAGVPRRPALELLLDGKRHSIERDRKAVQYHYDVGNEFFALFLDESMTYSCAIFSRGAKTLEEAQLAKLDLIATKLRLQEGQRVLDVGCGWGSFAMHAAKHYGVKVLGITLAEEQAKLARQRVADAGLSDQVEIRLADYRQLSEEPFDAISSIGMVEHVGETQIDVYTDTLARLLKPGGLLLNHGIAVTRPDDDVAADQIAMRYVFPDGDPLPLWRIEKSVELAGLFTQHIEGFQQDYADTLGHWYRNFEARLDEAERLAGAERTRIWRLYLMISKRTFEAGYVRVYQVLAQRPN